MIVVREDDERDALEEMARVRGAQVRTAERELMEMGLSPDDAFECVRLFGPRGSGERPERFARRTINQLTEQTD